MNWILDIIERIKWKIEDAIWAIQDKIEFNKETKAIEKELFEEVEIKPKKKKSKSKKKK